MAACDGVPRTHGSRSAGVAHARRGEFREDGVQRGAGLGSEIAGDRRHAVDVLAADGDAAPPGPIGVGEVAVGVEAVGEGVGQPGQFVGAMLAGQAGQMCFGFGSGFDVDEIRQPVDETANHRDMPNPMTRCVAPVRSRAAAAPRVRR